MRDSICWFSAQMATVAGMSRSKARNIELLSLPQSVGPKNPKQPLLLSQGLSRELNQVAQPGHKLALTWDACATGVGLACLATALFGPTGQILRTKANILQTCARVGHLA